MINYLFLGDSSINPSTMPSVVTSTIQSSLLDLESATNSLDPLSTVFHGTFNKT